MVLKLDGSTIGKWCPARQAMEVDFQVARALRGGTTAMRSMGYVFLPPDKREIQNVGGGPLGQTEYQARLNRTFLADGYNQGVGQVAARPFQRPVKLDNAELLPEELQRIEDDADRAGTSLTRLCHRALDAAIDRGSVHFLIDHPPPEMQIRGEDGKPTSRPRNGAEDIANDIRPYITIVNSDNLISWSWEKDETEHDVLAFIAIYEQRDMADDSGNFRVVDRIRFWTRDWWEVWERDSPSTTRSPVDVRSSIDLIQTAKEAGLRSVGDKMAPYARVARGDNPIGIVPLVSVVLNPYGSDKLQSRPCMHSLMWKNIEHWQIGSWRNNVLFYNGSPILVGAGVPKDVAEDTLTVGAGAVVLSNEPQMTLTYAEMTGASASALKERDEELKDEMQALSNAPMLRVQGGPAQTATGEARDEKQTQSKAQSWVELLEWGVYESFKMALRWQESKRDVELPEDFDVAIFRDFTMGARAESELRTISEARRAGDLSRETYLSEMAERGVLLTVDDVALELEKIEEEGPALGSLLAFGQEQVPPDGEEPDDEDGKNPGMMEDGEEGEMPMKMAKSMPPPAMAGR